VLAYTNIAALRQQVHPDSRIHGILKTEGMVCNIIPASAKLECKPAVLEASND
jgi:hypothetical protein